VIGTTVSHYTIVEPLGAGGMGIVYKARDVRLNRFVALKFLPPHIGADDQETARFLQEARAASALDHPNICTIHEIEQTEDGRLFIVMAFYAGETLAARMSRGPMPVQDALETVRQAAAGLARAHAHGIVHRDVKPANFILTTDGLVKVLDFGVAKLLGETAMTQTGSTVGTVGYMAPEQARGDAVDERADVWALGVILYEMLAGRRAFTGDNHYVVLKNILETEPVPLEEIRPDVPADVRAIVARALKKNVADRYRTAADFARDVGDTHAQLTQTHVPVAAAASGPSRRRMALAAAALVAVAVIGTAAWGMRRAERQRWAREEALPAVAAFADARQFNKAAALAREAERLVPGDPRLKDLWDRIAGSVSIETTPAGATVSIQPYASSGSDWQTLGTTPMPSQRVTRGLYRWRFEKPGHARVDSVAEIEAGRIALELPAADAVPADMILVPGSREVFMVAGLGIPVDRQLSTFLLDRYEVTNRQFKTFVDAGGYRRRELWEHPIVRDGKPLAWEAAMALFTDSTGQPGPATWEAMNYPADSADLPVGGVSWYEATAYAKFAGKSLPTIFHWYRAAGIATAPWLVPVSNFSHNGPVAVGSTGAQGQFGAYDMAGNVKEWCLNASHDFRYTLGGGWGEPLYLFGEAEARSPLDRAPNLGFRCVKYLGDGPDANTAEPVLRAVRDFRAEQPVSDEVFGHFVRLFKYDPIPLDARLERQSEPTAGVRTERVSFTAAYAGDRVVAYLHLPMNAPRPLQTFIFFPGSEGLQQTNSASLEQPRLLDFLVNSGRAVVQPVYRGMYERHLPRPAGGIALRDYFIKMAQDVSRTIDYLQTRRDLDATKTGYFGTSLGASFGPIPIAIDKRLSLAVLVGGGLVRFRWEPETETLNYLPRVRVPTLLLDGRYDFFFPLESSQKPFFDLLGTPPDRKQHVTVDSGHAVPRRIYVRTVLEWIDRYYGRVQ